MDTLGGINEFEKKGPRPHFTNKESCPPSRSGEAQTGWGAIRPMRVNLL